MASNELILRCQFQSGQRLTLKGLNQTSSVQELKEKIFLVTNVPCHAQKILIGFPPKVLNISDVTDQLYSIGIRSGDTLIIQKDNQAVTPVNQASEVSHSKLMRKIVPADNSCLFSSISFLMLGDTSFSGALRTLIVKAVSEDPLTFNEGFLGRSNQEYCTWISEPDRWGGAIEISILSKHYQTEINVVNTESTRVDRFGEDECYANRVFLIYDGIHYDPLGVMTSDGTPIQTVFNCNDEMWIAEAQVLGDEARKMNQFTNLSNFQLRCLICRLPLTGQAAAVQHAKETNHTNFGEVYVFKMLAFFPAFRACEKLAEDLSQNV